jgi:hypothetical protein
MAWIKIPEGSTEMQLPNGEWVKIPEGSTEMEIPDKTLSQWKDGKAEDDTDTIKTASDTKLIDYETSESKDPIDKEYDSKLNILSRQMESIEDPEIMDRYNIAVSKLEQEREEKKYKKEKREKDRLKSIEEGKKIPSSGSPLDRTLDVVSRIDTGLGGFQGSARMNLFAPLAEYMGMENEAKSLREEGGEQIETAKRVEEKFKETYGEDKWNVAQALGEYAPDAVMSFLMGAKNIPQAIGEAGVTYARTGDVETAIGAGVASFFGGKIADKLFEVGVKGVKTSFGKEIDNLPVDERDNMNKALDALDELGIDSLDEQARKDVLKDIDFTKGSEEITSKVKSELVKLKDEYKSKVDDAYSQAKKTAKESGTSKIKISDLKKMLSENDILIAGKNKKALKNISDYFKDFKDETSAEGIEVLLSNLKTAQRESKSGTIVYGKAIEYLQKKQSELVGDIYKEPRELSKQYNRIFEGRIKGEGADGGKAIKEVLEDDIVFNIGSSILKNGIDPDIARDLKRINLSETAKKDMVKDVLTKGLDIEDLSSKDNIKKILSRWNQSDKNGLKELLGSGYKPMEERMKALEVIQNTLETSPVKEGLGKNIINFITNASLVKVSPLYAYKGMAYEGREIATKMAFRKQQKVIRERIKEIPDQGVRNKLLKAFNSSMIGFTSADLDKMFKEEQED